jgi:hypothetical protein
MPKSTTSALARPATVPAPRGVPFQRICACGAQCYGNAQCPQCANKQPVQPMRRPYASPEAHAAQIPHVVEQVLRSAGQPLDRATRSYMERGLGHSFDRVRVHTDARAAQSAMAVNARAYTVGQDIVFAAGQFAPDSRQGRGLLAHELTHTVQQRASTPHLASLQLGPPSDSPSEREAERVRNAVLSNRSVGVIHQRSDATLQRDEGSPAGGCGVCYGTPANAGTAAHSLISAAFKRQNPRIQAPYTLLRPSPGDENGVLDLAVLTGYDSMDIGEIKPGNPRGLLQGDADLFDYESQLRKLGVRVSRMNLPPPIKSIPFPTLAKPPCLQDQSLYVNAPVHGIYTYWCTPDFKDLKSAGCSCEDKRRKAPDPPLTGDRLRQTEGDPKSADKPTEKGDGRPSDESERPDRQPGKDDGEPADRGRRPGRRPPQQPTLRLPPGVAWSKVLGILVIIAGLLALTPWGRIGSIIGTAIGTFLRWLGFTLAFLGGTALASSAPRRGGAAPSNKSPAVVRAPTAAPAPVSSTSARPGVVNASPRKRAPNATKIAFIEGLNLSSTAPGRVHAVWLYERGQRRMLAFLLVTDKTTAGNETSVELKSLWENRDGRNSLGGNYYTAATPYRGEERQAPEWTGTLTFTGDGSDNGKFLIAEWETLAEELQSGGRESDAGQVFREVQRLKALAKARSEMQTGMGP